MTGVRTANPITLRDIARLRDLCAEILAHAAAVERLKREVGYEVERIGQRYGFTPFGREDALS